MELSCGGSHYIHAQSDLEIQITLTSKGLENYRKVIEAVFVYAKRLLEAGP